MFMCHLARDLCALADLALMSGAQLFIREDLGLSDAQIEVLAGSINVFMLVSILAAGWVHYRKPESCRVSLCQFAYRVLSFGNSANRLFA